MKPDTFQIESTPIINEPAILYTLSYALNRNRLTPIVPHDLLFSNSLIFFNFISFSITLFNEIEYKDEKCYNNQRNRETERGNK